MDYGLALGRRFRALKLWFVLRAYGADGLAEIIAGHIALARELAGWIEAEPGWELLAPVPLSTVCFRRRPARRRRRGRARPDQRRPRRAGQRERDGVRLAHAGAAAATRLRMAIGNAASRPEHVRRAWEALNG